MRFDENIFTDCRIVAYSYREADVTSEEIKGYVHVVGELPFRAHLFSELQIQRYIKYCTKEKYSFVHVDATGGVLIKMREQNDVYIYGMVFKDGTDANDTITLAHAILTDHTVPSIGYFFYLMRYSVFRETDFYKIFKQD
ncbi:unnamed protein product [Adineta ricciae]|uniref:Uncharacterized protein n=1 Tax=Adineta ricciae TaxID=249248 RepID=A0A815SYP1_ADIRI|nr:unnamed protein product [Adineta ricciae]CAF1658362.1 unnamed protein product [Adineta ricciae]